MERYSVGMRESIRQRLESGERGSNDFHNAVCTGGKGRVHLTCVSNLAQESS